MDKKSRIDGLTAWARARGDKQSHWNSPDVRSVFHRLMTPTFKALLNPSFSIASDAKVFCIGSCFARNIEEHLIYRGKNVLSKRIVSPKTEWSARPNGLVNKFTTTSISNELSWAFGESAFPQSSLVQTKGGWIDLQLSPGSKPVSHERAIERREYLKGYFARAMDADVVVITLGLVETWYDNVSGAYLNATPPFWSVQREPERFSVETTGFAFNLATIESIWALLQLYARRRQKLVVTVSPVPLGVTFTGEDAAIANTYSKSVLRAVAGEFCRGKEDVAYFPSFEMVMHTERSAAFKERDLLHVKDSVVREVAHEFIAAYFGENEDAPDFHEMSYLHANPDVEDLVRSGELESGFEHWTVRGRSEGRALKPTDAS